ncbi:MAG: hypothetical protein IJL17_05485 [Kiritimatiellae bacterium]|nr:hypothetical protein [Kiritimatiellia bacterium]
MAKSTLRAGTAWRSAAAFLSACACALCAQGGTATFQGKSNTYSYSYPGSTSWWVGDVLPAAGDDVAFPLPVGGNIYWLDNTNAVNLGTVSATGWNWVMQFCNSNSQLVDEPHEFSIYDARGFNGWFRSLRPDVVFLPATASHTPIIQRFEATGRVRFGVPDAGTKAVISNLFGQGTVKFNAGAGELELARTSGDLLGIHYGSGKLTLRSPVGTDDTTGVEAIIAKAATHFDAQAFSTMTITDGKVTEWRDPENSSIRAVPFDGVKRGTAWQSHIPIPAPTYVADWRGTGKPVVDFGPYAHTNRTDFMTCGASALRFVKGTITSNGSAEWRDNMADVFVVFADNDPCARASFINDSYNAPFARGKVTDRAVYNINQTYSSEFGGLLKKTGTRNAKNMSVNGCLVPATHSVAGPKLRVVAMDVETTGNTSGERRVGAFARTGFDYWGGVAIGELICFKTSLTETERQTVIAYLKKRWLPEDEQDVSTVGELTSTNNATIGVPAGESAVVRHYVNRHNATLVKEDGGTLLVGDATGDTLDVAVAGGKVGFSKRHDYDGLAPAATPTFHFDASDINSFTFSNANGVAYIERWQDQNDPSVAAVPVTNLTLKATNAGTPTFPACPTYLANDCNGMPAVYFGPIRTLSSFQANGYQDSATLVFRDSSVSEHQTFREGFAVVKLCGIPAVFGTDTTMQNVHPTTWCFTDKRYSDDSVMGGSWAINGEVFDAERTINSVFPEAEREYVVVRMSVAKGQSVTAFALDRKAPGSAGGLKISEYLIYDRPLSDVERVNTEAYLMRKWLGKEHPYLSTPALGNISYADGLVAEIPVAGTARVDRLIVPSGSVVKTGPGTLAAGMSADSVSSLSVQEGELSLAETLVLSNALAKAAFHVDASATNSIVFVEGSDTVVDQWNDVRGASFGYANHWDIWGGRPSYARDELNGMPVVDFGTYRFTNGSYYWGQKDYQTASNNCAAVTDGSGLLWNRQLNLREGFQVFKLAPRPDISKTYPPVVGAKEHCNFHPHTSNLITFGGNNAHTNLKVMTEWSVDKEFCDIHTQTWGTVRAEADYRLYSFSVTNLVSGYGYPVGGAFAYERMQGAGGMKLAEGVFFTQTLTPEERLAIRDYLLRKWKCDPMLDTNYALDSLHVADGAKVSFPNDRLMSVSACDASGTVEGNLALAEGGVINVAYGGSGFTGMTVSGTATLPASGRVEVTLADGVKPAPGTSLAILTAGALTGGVSGWHATVLNADGTHASSIALLARDGAALRLTFAPKGTLVIFR